MSVLKKENIFVNQSGLSRSEIIDKIGERMIASGLIDKEYIEGMHKRDEGMSVAIGNKIAIPHGELDYKKFVKETGLIVMLFPAGVDWGGTEVKLVVGIAAKGEEHLDVLANIGDAFEDESAVDEAASEGNVDKLFGIFTA